MFYWIDMNGKVYTHIICMFVNENVGIYLKRTSLRVDPKLLLIMRETYLNYSIVLIMLF